MEQDRGQGRLGHEVTVVRCKVAMMELGDLMVVELSLVKGTEKLPWKLAR